MAAVECGMKKLCSHKTQRIMLYIYLHDKSTKFAEKSLFITPEGNIDLTKNINTR